MRLLVPFVPHIARECLELMNSKNFNTWPKIKKKDLELSKVRNIVVQINGKTRDVLKLDGSISEKECWKLQQRTQKQKNF